MDERVKVKTVFKGVPKLTSPQPATKQKGLLNSLRGHLKGLASHFSRRVEYVQINWSKLRHSSSEGLVFLSLPQESLNRKAFNETNIVLELVTAVQNVTYHHCPKCNHTFLNNNNDVRGV